MTDGEVSLRDHMEQRLTSLRDYIDTRLADLHRAKDVESRTLEHKFEQVNELREQVLQERGMYPRIELLDAVRERVGRLERLIPIVGLAAAIAGGVLTTVAMRLFGITAAWR